MSQKKSSADKFTGLFDDNWKEKKSTVRTKFAGARTYDPSYSWDARSDNPEHFSRLESKLMPLQTVRPIVLSHNAVVPLEESTGMEVLNVKQPSSTLSYIPLTQEQRDVGMTKDLTGTIPMCVEAVSKGKHVVLKEPLGFKNMDMRPAEFKSFEMPSCLIEAGPQCDKKVNLFFMCSLEYSSNHIFFSLFFFRLSCLRLPKGEKSLNLRSVKQQQMKLLELRQ